MMLGLIAFVAINQHADAARVLVVINKASEESNTIGRYYMKQRGIPGQNLVLVNAPLTEQILPPDYHSSIEGPMKAKLAAFKGIDFIVMTKGVPLRVTNGAGFSVDSLVGSISNPLTDEQLYDPAKQPPSTKNPYFGKAEKFSRTKFGYYIVTRLDAYTVDQAKGLVDLAMKAKPEKGSFFMDCIQTGKGTGYYEMNESLRAAGPVLSKKGFGVTVEETNTFAGPSEPLMGYASWGSNDGSFDASKYKSLRFKPGAIAETFVSTSGRTFKPTTGGQSLIADLVSQGVTGVKGYVGEPYTVALAQPHILFDRYTSGFNLAESFSAASPLIRWKDIIIGDPLCAPYGK
ncbi:MAG TPA: TIGR03790 family protein [Fimbriimonadaceae bacterium]|nr:TIGR03790 family protein [Fimbriimonadaceae bacterium]